MRVAARAEEQAAAGADPAGAVDEAAPAEAAALAAATGATAGASGSDGMGGAAGGDASAGTGGAAGAAGATGGTGGTAATGGTGGSGGATGTGGAAGTGGTGGRGGTGGAVGTGGAAGTGGGPIDAGPQNWCATQARPAGVVAADYQCLDFESGLPPVTTWAPLLVGTASRSITTARASSLPQSLLTTQSGGTGTTRQEARLQWHNVGAMGVTSVSIFADINPVNFPGVVPPWTGSIDLLCISFGSGEGCLSYTRGADLSFADGYTGYFIEHQYTGGPAYQFQCQLTAPACEPLDQGRAARDAGQWLRPGFLRGRECGRDM